MYQFLSAVLAIICVLIIMIVVMQPTKTNAASSLAGGAEELFVRRKSRGFEAFLQRVTFVLLALFFILSIVMMYMTYKGI